MIKAIIFDFFGVFRTDSYNGWLIRNNRSRVGDFFDASYQVDMGKMTRDEFLLKIGQLVGRTVTAEELDEGVSIDQAVVKLADGLSYDYRLGLISNAPSKLIRQLLADNNLNRLFDKIVISSEVGMVKPHPDIFEHTLLELGIAADEALFIDDNIENVEQAHKLGITSLQFISADQLGRDLAAIGITGVQPVN
ncbi:MAG: HAD family phosphatase [Candidatus Saccharibacteria bacterium]